MVLPSRGHGQIRERGRKDLMSSLLQAIKTIIADNEWNKRTCIPAKVLSIDNDTQECVVQVMLKTAEVGDIVLDIPPIESVPLLNLSSGTGQFSNPVVGGTLGLLVISDRILDEYLLSDGSKPVEPSLRRSHSLSDAVFIPGLYPYSKSLGTDPRLTVMRHNAGINNASNPGENAVHLHPIGDQEAIVIGGNRHTDQLATIKVNQDGSIKITSDEGNSSLSEFHMKNDGSIVINANGGTNITLTQAGDITVLTPAAVSVVSATADVTCTGNVTVDGAQIHFNGSDGGSVNANHINHVTGLPHGDGSSTVLHKD